MDITKIRTWLTNKVAQTLNINTDEVDDTIPFERYGLESADIVGIMADLEDWLDCEIDDPTLMYEYPTIQEFSEYLVDNYAV
ncbi:MAG: acyl carrier protein [Crocosphaera sp.]|nr:acyl carrier protein [Crocosphaera sp.]